MLFDRVVKFSNSIDEEVRETQEFQVEETASAKLRKATFSPVEPFNFGQNPMTWQS